MPPTTKLGVLLSGTGRTLTNLLEHIGRGELDAEVRCVIADRDGIRGIDLARAADLPTYLEPDSAATFAILRRHEVDLVCLCGYLRKLTIPEDFRDRVLNIHPALLPKFGGQGFYGTRVHAAVLAASETESGCTVHYCDDEYDRGPILLQKRVAVHRDDTTDSLADRVFAAECEAYPEAIRLWQAGRG